MRNGVEGLTGIFPLLHPSVLAPVAQEVTNLKGANMAVYFV